MYGEGESVVVEIFNFINALIGELIAFPYIFLIFAPFKDALRYSKKVFYICMSLFLAHSVLKAVILHFLNVDFSFVVVTIFITLAAALILFCVLIKAALPIRLYAFFVVATYALGVSNIASHIEARYFPENFYTYSAITHNSFHVLLICLTILFLRKFLLKQTTAAVKNGEAPAWKIMWLIPLMFFLIITLYTEVYSHELLGTLQYLIILILILFCSFAVFHVAALMVIQTINAAKLAQQVSLLERDELTGLYGNNKFRSIIENIENYAESIAVIFFDVNDLKFYNDTKGHKAGDLLIKKAAESIISVCEEKTHAFRIGGDEFVAVIPNCTESDINGFLKKWRENLAKLNEKNDGVYCSVAVGTAFGSGNFHIGDLMALADERMYIDKRKMKDSPKSKFA